MSHLCSNQNIYGIIRFILSGGGAGTACDKGVWAHYSCSHSVLRRWTVIMVPVKAVIHQSEAISDTAKGGIKS